MARINLLPWREELRKQYLKEFLASIGVGVVITLLALCFVHYYIEGMKDYQDERNKRLQTEIALLNVTLREIKDIETKKHLMLGKIEVIHKLQLSRPEIVHLFDDLAKTLPEGVYLTRFDQAGKALTMKGLSQSNARISAYMRGIEASEWLQSPQLNIIQASKGQRGHTDEFILRANQGKKPKPQVKTGEDKS